MSRTDATILVSCDGPGCDVEEEIQLTATARGWDERNVDGELRRLGWRDEGDNIHTCSVCLEDWDGGE